MKQFSQHYKDNSSCHNSADVMGLYPSISHEVGLRALREALDKREEKTILTEELLKQYFELSNTIKQQISAGTAIGTKFSPPYACIFPRILKLNS